MKFVKLLFVAGLIATGAGAVKAQESLEVFRLPPSVGATPIEIPGAGRQSATPIEIPGAGRYGATPIEIPGKSRGDLVADLPIPIAGSQAETLSPRSARGQFSARPLPIPEPRAIKKMGDFVYAILPDGTIYGDTDFGYSRFDTLETYQRFLRAH
ncbi:MAG: hypothetical protein FH759_13115 [Sediminimonas qiaohouensis]|uniref:Uncharacterized protein n=1 Tax=Sediminimonas qiaohouensis TaxID=552061 RepID=A0A7C9LMJ8_9RHOB|nr:hypothetical protein [Sediminimonas qiaohouensis]MTJ05619.1 hypothetical protein [Sediminimonas qiaohouensis]